MNIYNEIEKIELYAKEEVSKISNLQELGNSRIKYLGRNGNLTQILRNLERYPIEERKAIGKKANEVRAAIEKAIDEKQKYLENSEHEQLLDKEQLDVTATLNKIPLGHIHPITEAQNRAEKIFSDLGFEIVDGPEIEKEFYNFDALNIPAHHPARDMWDTFWLKSDKKLLMRTHTSPVQVRYLETHKSPFRIIVPGRVFRHEATDARHESTFQQLEGLMVGDDITVANIRSILEAFFSAFFETEVKVRLRPSFFPFVEPGFEGDISCNICEGKGCKLCKNTGWLEMFGAGMVNQEVFVAAGYPRNKYQGFAFGLGFDRFPMMRYGIDDIRLFRNGDLRFLEQF